MVAALTGATFLASQDLPSGASLRLPGDGQVSLVHQVVDEQAVPELPAQLDHDGTPT
jgi:hypothetical protein